jgi:hypothetical protein
VPPRFAGLTVARSKSSLAKVIRGSCLSFNAPLRADLQQSLVLSPVLDSIAKLVLADAILVGVGDGDGKECRANVNQMGGFGLD